jgi:PAS domain S-box-containing protein
MPIDENSQNRLSEPNFAAEDFLAQADREWKRTFDAFADPVMVLDERCKIVRANKPMIDMLGRAEGDVIGKKCFEVVHEGSENFFDCPHMHLLADGSEHSTEYFEPRLGVLLEVRVAPLRDGNGKLTGSVHIMRDISQRKKMQEALRQSESTLKTVLQTAPVGIGLLKDRTFKWTNEFLSSISGYGQGELLEHDIRMLWESGGEFEQAWQTTLQRLQGAGTDAIEARWKTKDGTVIDISGSLAAINPQDLSAGVVFTALDVTGTKSAEKALRKSEEHYRAVFTNAGIGINVTDCRTNMIVQANPALQKMLGYEEDELLQLTPLDITHPDDREITKQRIDSLMQGELDSFSLEKRYVRKDGSLLCGHLSVSPIRDDEGNPTAAVGLVVDTTERKRVEIALKESEQRLRLIIDSSPTGIVIVRDDMLVYVNPRFTEMLGYESADEMTSLSLSSVLMPQSTELIVQRTVDTGEGPKVVSNYEATLLSKSGKRISIASWVTDIRYLGKNSALAFVIDVTESKDLRAQLLQSQKMEAMGTLAGGLAHDFNNLLTVILGFSELLLVGKSDDDLERVDLQRICEAARNGAELIQRILMFSRKKDIKLRALNLNHEISHVKNLLGRTIPKMIEIELMLAEDLARVSADPSTVEQILLNFAVNAKDAMPHGGKLTIRTDNVFLDDEYCRTHLSAKVGHYVLLSVSDTGHGMEKELLDHIFEPFFTTKEMGRGTGLGLAMVYGIVKQHNGYITCDSQPGAGTTFSVYLPVTRDEEQPEPVVPQKGPLDGTETILLVDDEEMVRNLGKRILERHGYTVLSATNGKEALTIYAREKGKIAVVILDLIMPVLGGWQCLQELLIMDPGVNVLISSGYASGGTVNEPARFGAKAFVPKPYNAAQMLQTLRDILD